ncbi:hypothetical protein CACET_c34880 [Clostridium aceticum]|uniref:DUF8052 domain-containing protein n=1 Tax=Clostridium aceticum TaxID=84022 RepID=A0A0D8I648_9CLOT|nr:hypothetical protein [Clostridium aceticum]AKL96931.1 hypothetical protein CACET_c34880 [Clostridium aceticum]KJF25497.1 hypothetical protein TZ02_18380 [Clostridium aceticum]
MKAQRYVEGIEEKLSKFFNIEKAYLYNEIEFDLFAKSFIRNERYIASKKIKIYSFENSELYFVKRCEVLNEENFLQLINTFRNASEELVNPHSEHMSTIITGIVIVERELSEELRKNIEKFKFNRSFAFGFKGWTYTRLVAADLSKGEVITNRRGREVKDIIRFLKCKRIAGKGG